MDEFREHGEGLGGDINGFGGFIVEFEPEDIFGAGDGQPAAFASSADGEMTEEGERAHENLEVLIDAEAGADGDGVGNRLGGLEQSEDVRHIDELIETVISQDFEFSVIGAQGSACVEERFVGGEGGDGSDVAQVAEGENDEGLSMRGGNDFERCIADGECVGD